MPARERPGGSPSKPPRLIVETLDSGALPVPQPRLVDSRLHDRDLSGRHACRHRVGVPVLLAMREREPGRFDEAPGRPMSNLSNRCERPDSAGADPPEPTAAQREPSGRDRWQERCQTTSGTTVSPDSACGFALATRTGDAGLRPLLSLPPVAVHILLPYRPCPSSATMKPKADSAANPRSSANGHL